MKYAENQVKVT